MGGSERPEGLLSLGTSHDPYDPDLCDPLTPGPGTRRLVKVSSTGTESSDDFEERDPGEAGSRWSRMGAGVDQAP